MDRQTARVRIIIVGGFLGAGKTTAIGRLARHYIDEGQSVGIVTNDQAEGLVDTAALRAQGFSVGEVAGACFCCQFTGLIDVLGRLTRRDTPDTIIAEPVGSCTDLFSTVVRPIREFYGDQYRIGPLAVLLKPEHGRRILRNDRQVGFSSKAAYIFLKQIEEAGIVVVNKTDRLTAAERDELLSLVTQRFPEKTVLGMSARDGNGFDDFVQTLDNLTETDNGVMDVDYDVYAEGEAELGWLNATAKITGLSPKQFDTDALIQDFLAFIQQDLVGKGEEPVHLKAIIQGESTTAMANVVDGESPIELSLASRQRMSLANLILNARVTGAPESIQRTLESACTKISAQHHVSVSFQSQQCFRPARPKPTYRTNKEGMVVKFPTA